MKKCDYFKDFILTDYLDGELDKGLAHSVEIHLRDCSDCRAFLNEVKNNAAAPFQRVLPQPVPSELWEAVRQEIEYEPASPWMVFPRLVPVFASLVLMFLAGSITLNTIQIKQAQEKDQGEYLVSLWGPASSAVQGDNNDFGTPIEHYFL
jgi:predicted anti-sigma-YlaC factor YlaD